MGSSVQGGGRTGIGPTGAREGSALGAALVEILRELDGVVSALSAAQYTRRCGESFADATIGGHVRHCLDHARALVDGRSAGRVDYDHRVRGTDIEQDPAAARAELDRLGVAAAELESADPLEPLTVCVMVAKDGARVEVGSTLGRELSFVLSHTVHHNAMVRGMAISLGVKVPRTFGYAPSTLAHADGTACAR